MNMTAPIQNPLLSITNKCQKCTIFLEGLVRNQDTNEVEIPKYVSLKGKNQETWLRVHTDVLMDGTVCSLSISCLLCKAKTHAEQSISNNKWINKYSKPM